MQSVSGRIPELDGLRGIAIGMVLVFHAAVYVHVGWAPLGEIASLGWSGVDLFFVLSGFLIGGILLDQRNSEEFFRPFYARRVFRILPPYLAVLAGYGVVWMLGGEPRHAITSSVGGPMPAWVYLTFTNNLYLATHGTLFFLPATWSLAIEEQFYLTLPLLVRYLPQRWLPRIVFSSIAVVLCVRVTACVMGTLTQGQMYMLPWFRADTLMVGVGCAMIARSPSLAALVQRQRVALYVLLVLGGVILWRVGWWLAPEHERPRVALTGWGLTLIALVYGGVLLTAVLACPAWFSRFLRWRALRFLGGISYFAYLAHQPLLAAALNVVSEVRGRWQSIAQWCAMGVAYALTLLIGHLSWKYYESRMVILGHYWKFSRRRIQGGEPAVKIAA